MRKFLVLGMLLAVQTAHAFDPRPEGPRLPDFATVEEFRAFMKSEIRSFAEDFSESFFYPKARFERKVAVIDELMESRDYKRCISPKLIQRALPGRAKACKRAGEVYEETVGVTPLEQITEIMENLARFSELTQKYRMEYDYVDPSGLTPEEYARHQMIAERQNYYTRTITQLLLKHSEIKHELNEGGEEIVQSVSRKCLLPYWPKEREKRAFFACHLQALRSAYSDDYLAMSERAFAASAEVAILQLHKVDSFQDWAPKN